MSISNTQRHFLLHVASNSFISLGTKEQKKLKRKNNTTYDNQKRSED